MYDDLECAARPSVLERIVVNALIPSMIVTLALQRPAIHSQRPEPIIPVYVGVVVPDIGSLGSVPDAFPILISLPRPVYPALMRRSGIEGRVVLRALVRADGRVDSTSILIMRTPDVAFAPAAVRALAHAVFRPARFGGQTGAAWITIALDFKLRQE